MAAMQEYTIQMDDEVPDGMSQAFQEMLQNQSAAMSRMSMEQKKADDRLEELEREHQQLRAKNAELNKEVAELKGDAVGVGAMPATKKGSGPAFELVRKIPHEAPVHSVTTKQGESLIATASWDGMVRIYDLAKEEAVTTLGDINSEGDRCKMLGLYDVAFAKTADDILGCASSDKSVYLWNYQTSKLLAKLVGHNNEVNSIDFHSAQQVMATASDDCSAIIWDFQEGIVLRTLGNHSKAVYGATFLGQENQYLLATCSFDQLAYVWDMRDKKEIVRLRLHTDDVIGIDYSNSLLATGSDDGVIGIFDTRKWKEATSEVGSGPLQCGPLHRIDTTKLDVDDNEVKRVSFSPDGDLLAAACSSGRVLVYDVNTLGTSDTPTPYGNLGGNGAQRHGDCVFGVTMGVDHNQLKYVVSASHDHNCFYWREVKK